MPSVAEAQHQPPVVSPCKKRRREGERDALLEVSDLYERLGAFTSTTDAAAALHTQTPFAAQDDGQSLMILDRHGDQHAPVAFPRRILPLPVAKKIRLGDGGVHALEGQPQYASPHDARQRSGRSRSRSPMAHNGSSRALQAQMDASNRTQPTTTMTSTAMTRTTSSLLLKPCHVCHRRPTKKSELDSFANCDGCGQRTCFVCLRECPGWLPSPPRDDGRSPARAGRGNGHDDRDYEHDDDSDVLPEEQEALSRSFHMDDAGDYPPARTDAQPDMRNQNGDDDAHERGRPRRRGDDEPGWESSGHRQVVCSRCCVEKGSEGDVVCLGCLSRTETG